MNNRKIYHQMNQKKSEEDNELRSNLTYSEFQIDKLKEENMELSSNDRSTVAQKPNVLKLQKENMQISENTIIQKSNDNSSRKKPKLFESDLKLSANHIICSEHNETPFEFDERIKNGINHIFSGPDFLSDEMITRARIFQEVFFEEFLTIKCDDLVNKIEKMKIQGHKFIDVFMLFCLQKNLFEKYWEDFYDMPLYIKEKKEVLESVPIEWVIEHIEDKPKPKKFLLVYENPETMNGLKKYIIRYEKMLYEFFCELVERKPQAIMNLLSQAGFDAALEEDTPLGRKLVLGILEAGGLGFVNEKNIGLLSEEQIELCYKEDYKKYVNMEDVIIGNKENFYECVGNGDVKRKNEFKDEKLLYKNYVEKEVDYNEEDGLRCNGCNLKSDGSISFDGEIDDLTS